MTDARLMTADRRPLIAVVGPTASGKTRRAVQLARALVPAEIISADSRQVYRAMDLGTGKDLDEYGEVPYHLIDIAEPGDKYNLYRYVSDARRAIADIRSHGAWPVVCGGTGMYVENLLRGVELPEVPANPELRARLERLSLEQLTGMLASMKTLHNTTDVDTVKRAVRAIEIQTYYDEHPELAAKTRQQTPEDSLIFCVDIPRDLRRSRITARLRERLDGGMVDEVRGLLVSGVSADDLIYYGLEYKFVTLYCIGQLSYDEMFVQLEQAIHQFAKRQMTWFRGMERRGCVLHHFDHDMPEDEFVGLVRRKIAEYYGS